SVSPDSFLMKTRRTLPSRMSSRTLATRLSLETLNSSYHVRDSFDSVMVAVLPVDAGGVTTQGRRRAPRPPRAYSGLPGVRGSPGGGSASGVLPAAPQGGGEAGAEQAEHRDEQRADRRTGCREAAPVLTVAGLATRACAVVA